MLLIFNYLRSPTKDVVYHIGIQVSVANKGPGQMPANPGKFQLGTHFAGDSFERLSSSFFVPQVGFTHLGIMRDTSK